MQAEPAERVAWPLVPAGPGRESRRGLSLSGVTEPKRFARSLGWQPGPAPVCPGKAFLLVSSSLLLAARFSPGTGARRCPGAVTLVATRPQHSPAAPLSRPLMASLSVPGRKSCLPLTVLSANIYRFLQSGRPSAQRPALRVWHGRATRRGTRAFSVPLLGTVWLSSSSHSFFSVADIYAQIRSFLHKCHPSWETIFFPP